MEKFNILVKTILKEYFSNGGYLVSTLTSLSMKVLLIANIQFGTLLVKQIMDENGHSVTEAEDLLSWINLASNLLGLVISFSMGLLSDKIAIYKLMTFINIIVLSTWYLIWVDISQDKIGYFYIAGFILSSSTLHTSALLGSILLGKICNENTRGTMFGFNGVFGSCGICLL